MQELNMIWSKNVFQNNTLVGEKAAYFKCNLHPKRAGLGSLHVVVLKFIFIPTWKGRQWLAHLATLFIKFYLL